MNKRLLIISPYFPPGNAADMHRVRTSLPFYAEFGWDAEVVTVDPQYCDVVLDDLLKRSLPEKVIIHRVKALDKRKTGKFGLGSIALRSLWYYFLSVNKLLRTNHYDVIFFSTTQFPVLVLGRLWKRRSNPKIVFDIQDPWHTDYYKTRPKTERPKKYWFSYHLNKMLEPIAMSAANGLISVSDGYLKVLHHRYPYLKSKPAAIIPFGMHMPDLHIARSTLHIQPSILEAKDKFNLVYVGRGGEDLLPALKLLMGAIKIGLQKQPELFRKLRVQLFGTSYAPAGCGKPAFSSEIQKQGLSNIISEITDRLPFYQTLNTLGDAQMLFLPGPEQPDYIASKIFPYLMVQKPILAILHKDSSGIPILSAYPNVSVFAFDQDDSLLIMNIYHCLCSELATGTSLRNMPEHIDKGHSSAQLTILQTNLFNQVCDFPN